MNIEAGTLPSEVIKYLNKYSLEKRSAEYSGAETFNNIAVIPAIKEYGNIIKLIESLALCDSAYFPETLFLFVINNTLNAPDEIIEDNRRSIALLRNFINGNETHGTLNGTVLKSGIRIGFIDASSEGKAMPVKEGGVGYARKIGMDAALELFNYKNKRKKILICLDADCTVNKQYLTSIVESFNKKDLNAGYVNFEHPLPDDDESRLAIINYEIFLRYYVLGLIYAGSSYAIHTIGSTMLCTYESYIKVEGMNKKKAAEDFYFMEKLCKNYSIHKVDGASVYPSSRGSWRVPFGTGQRVNRYLSKEQNEYLLYSPSSFEVLKKWNSLFNSGLIQTAAEYLGKAAEIHPALYGFLIQNNFEESWCKIASNCKSTEQLAKQKHFWFDGFRTLKLIHHLRDNGIPQEEMFGAVESVLKKMGNETGININGSYRNSIPEQLVYLKKLREIA